ncbi:phosphoketolase [Streptomyces sp. LBL]|nr:phosphoketolase [Streptomyces sp. LBL]
MSVDTQQASAPPTQEELKALDAPWRAANHLAVGPRSTSWPTPC